MNESSKWKLYIQVVNESWWKRKFSKVCFANSVYPRTYETAIWLLGINIPWCHAIRWINCHVSILPWIMRQPTFLKVIGWLKLAFQISVISIMQGGTIVQRVAHVKNVCHYIHKNSSHVHIWIISMWWSNELVPSTWVIIISKQHTWTYKLCH